MIATYNQHIIEATKQEDGLYHVTIDGIESGITAKYKTSAINKAVRACQEHERTNQIKILKEVGL